MSEANDEEMATNRDRGVDVSRTERIRLETDGDDIEQACAERKSSLSTLALQPNERLDPAFERHRKFDLIAAERAVQGRDVTGRFGPVDGTSVVAASLLTSELSTPWSHVLRGQKW